MTSMQAPRVRTCSMHPPDTNIPQHSPHTHGLLGILCLAGLALAFACPHVLLTSLTLGSFSQGVCGEMAAC